MAKLSLPIPTRVSVPIPAFSISARQALATAIFTLAIIAARNSTTTDEQNLTLTIAAIAAILLTVPPTLFTIGALWAVAIWLAAYTTTTAASTRTDKIFAWLLFGLSALTYFV